MLPSVQRVAVADSVLVIVDVQDKLLALIQQTPALLINIEFLLDAGKLLNVPVLATEQYPKGLGPTAASIAQRLPRPIPEKTAFSCCGSTEFAQQVVGAGRSTAVLAGIESHVCVLQTALDLLERGSKVVIPVDAVAARGVIDHDTALHRLERAGVLLTTSEAVVFEWLGSSASPVFKSASALVQERSKRLRVVK
jgi:nicotinamidase-related amidase